MSERVALTKEQAEMLRQLRSELSSIERLKIGSSSTSVRDLSSERSRLIAPVGTFHVRVGGLKR
jgi:hypothetical protein